MNAKRTTVWGSGIALLVCLLGASGSGWAQEAPGATGEAAARADRERQMTLEREATRLTPLSVEVVISRHRDGKRISSLPYSLAVNANRVGTGGVAQARMGANVPVPTILIPRGTDAGTGPTVVTAPFQYRDIGTNIDCSAQTLEDNRFQVTLKVEDTSVYTDIRDDTTPTADGAPVFRTFRSTNTLVLRDGQTREFTAATDRVSGEVVRVEVTLRVVE